MKDKIIVLLYRIYIFIIRKLSNDIIKTTTICNTLIYNKIYLKVFETNTDNTIKKNHEFSKYIFESILGIKAEIEDEYKEKLDLVKDEIIRSESKLIAKHYILSAYFNYYIGKNSFFTKFSKVEIRNDLKKAKTFDSKVKLLKTKNYTSLKKDIKSELKSTSKEIIKINKEKIKLEKEKAIEPIDIKMSSIITFFSVVSSLSLIGGVIYNQLLFYFLGVNASYFFNISDYISSSIDVLSIVFFTMVLAIPFYFLKFSHVLNEVIVDEQYGTNIQDKNDKLESISKWVILIGLLGIVSLDYYNNKQVDFDFIGIFLYFVIIFSLPKLSLWRYIKNAFFVNLSILILFNFIYLLITKSYTQANEIKTNNFNNEYKVILKEDIKSSYKFIQTNSNYTFLYSDVDKKVIIIPNNEVKKIEYIHKETN